MKKPKPTRTRTFATIVYPESAPPDWLEIVQSYHVQTYISPLHDKDTNPDGEIKKPHYHVLFIFDGVKSDSQIESIIASIGGVGRENVDSTRGYARYLCHLDNPEKFQYDREQVKVYGGGDYTELISSSASRSRAIRDMMIFIRSNGILDFCDFLDYCMEEEPDWFYLCCQSCTFVISTYCDSLRKKVSRQA